jgi:hypothetical protein
MSGQRRSSVSPAKDHPHGTLPWIRRYDVASPPPPHRVRGTAIVGSLLLLLMTGCGADDGSGPADQPKQTPPPSRSASIPAAAPPRVEKIAGLTDCEAEVRIEADQLREGVCKTPLGNFVVTTFPKEKYKLTWLESAGIYGGKYLVGPRWAIGAEPKVLERLRPKVGGTIEDLGKGLSGSAPAAAPTPN